VAGVVMLAGCRAGVSSIEIPVREAKKVLTGNGSASKMQLEESVRGRLNHKTPIRPYHASDAVGLALIGFYRYHEINASNGRKA
jgi:crossover junction endodeoxyribonuclease RuvC